MTIFIGPKRSRRKFICLKGRSALFNHSYTLFKIGEVALFSQVFAILMHRR